MYISNAGFPCVVGVSEYLETESSKSLATLQNTVFLNINIFYSTCCASPSAVYKDAKQFGKIYAWELRSRSAVET